MEKVLIITYYWPPAGGPGVQRWLRFVKYLPQFGFAPWVYIPQNPHYPITDASLQQEVPQGIQLLQHPIKEPYRWAALFAPKQTHTLSSGILSEKAPSFAEQLLLWIRGNFFIPDARSAWVQPSIAFLSEIIAKHNIQTLITTGPPHSLHLIGMALKKKYPLQWLADFRDPWTAISYHSKLRLSKAAQRKHKALERAVLNQADKLVVTSPTTQRAFKALTPKPIQLITNGFDEALAPVSPTPGFALSHTGSLLTARNPVGLWKALQLLVQQHADFAQALQLRLAGVVGEEVLHAIAAHGLRPYLKLLGYLPHKKVVQVQQQSQVLLLLEANSPATRSIIPAKMFEYFNAQRPILALGPSQWDAATLVRTAQAGAVCAPTDVAALKRVLLNWFRRYQQGTLHVKAKNIERYHRRALTQALANFIRWELS